MIADPEVFDDEHLPRELMHRDPEVNQLSRALEPVVDGDRADDVLLSGPSGVGKTVLARHTVGRLRDLAPLASAHIHCLGQTAGDVLREILDQHPTPTPDRVTPTTPVDELQAILEDVADRPMVLILDEADGLPETDVLTRLASVPGASTIPICHDPDRWLAHVDGDARRRFADADRHIRLDRYGVDALADILRARADHGLLPGVVTRAQLTTIADEVAGVARVGIQALHAAAELAAERGHETIEDGDVADSYAHARHRIRAANLRSLPYHHQVLYALVRQAVGARLEASELHERYEQISARAYVDQPRTAVGRRSRRNKLRKLIDYDLITEEGPDQDRRYAVVDASIEPPIEIPNARVR